MPIRRTLSPCCACAVNGHAAAEPAITLMKSRRRTVTLRSEVKHDASFQSLSDWGGDVRFGSKADMCVAKRHVRFTPNRDHESGHRQTVMSALPPCVDGSELARTFLNVCSIGRCSHVFGLLARHVGPLAIMPCADQVPINGQKRTSASLMVYPCRVTGRRKRAPA